MTPSVKKLCIYSLTVGLGQKIKEETEDEVLQYRMQKLQESGQYAVDTCFGTIDNSRIKQIKKKIDHVYKGAERVDILDMLLFLLTACTDLEESGCKDISLEVIIRRLLWCLQLFDPKMDNTDRYIKTQQLYKEWIA